MNKNPGRYLSTQVSRKKFIGSAAFLILCGLAASLSSQITMTTYYPSPAGIYNALISTGQTLLARDGGKVGINTAAPAVSLDVAQNGAIKIGDAYLSSGVPGFTELASNEWFNGASWQTNGNPGALYQQTGPAHYWWSHDAAGNHSLQMQLDSSGNLYVQGQIIHNSYPAFVAAPVYDDCTGNQYAGNPHPSYLGCPSGFVISGMSWHVGEGGYYPIVVNGNVYYENGCDGWPRGCSYWGCIAQGWMTLCVAQ